MFAIISYIESKNKKGVSYKITQREFMENKYLEILCFNKRKIKSIEKKIYKKIDKTIISKDLEEIKFKRLNIYSPKIMWTEIAKDAFYQILAFYKPESLLLIDPSLENIDFIKTIIVKCKLLYVATDIINEFSILCTEVYQEYGILPILYNKNQNFDIGIDFDNCSVAFKKLERMYSIRRGSASFNKEIYKLIPKNIDTNIFINFLIENKLCCDKLFSQYCLSKSYNFYDINEQNIKNLLDN